MRTPTILVSALLVLLPVALAGSAAAAVPASCSFVLNFWDATYGCKVSNVGPAGSVTWCPSPALCADGTILACTGSLLFPCTLL
jgi:hypothetical protein